MTQNADYAPGLHTCDSCAEGQKKCINWLDAYVCEECVAHHERATDAATDAVLASYMLFGNLHGKAWGLSRPTVREIVVVALDAYDMAMQNDSSGSDS